MMCHEPEKEPPVAYQPTSPPAHQPYALKSGGGFARLTNNYAQRQSQMLTSWSV
jgi:hypothetical protein